LTNTKYQEFSCELWHSSLSKINETDIERVQKSVLKVILKNKYEDYGSALKLLNMASLKDIRSKLCLQFTKKCLKIENLKKKLFPRKKTKHDMKKRTEEKFLINNIVTERYKRSSIPAMKKMLNEEDIRLKIAMQNIIPITGGVENIPELDLIIRFKVFGIRIVETE